jgi:hypothetical protein
MQKEEGIRKKEEGRKSRILGIQNVLTAEKFSIYSEVKIWDRNGKTFYKTWENGTVPLLNCRHGEK